MQAVKEKIMNLNATRKARQEARAEERAEKEIAKARMDVAREIRLAKEAEAEMDLHVANAGKRVDQEIYKVTANNPRLVQDVTLTDRAANPKGPRETTNVTTYTN
ncbi:hypothetical protein LR48_Vigan05g074300 [Vigna angularis]|uniref:Uncharacterized protein n=1 Tax=Phaseolus angularis TaxID=3914 RepID=A0A0L9UKQ0_PHAAN|nr:uncharacterized protein HKW66_Vig0211020 [Vigna angularis]KOM43139.1 hypothetical protein LR48_Vigan05g074300 [Vigna angularis]